MAPTIIDRHNDEWAELDLVCMTWTEKYLGATSHVVGRFNSQIIFNEDGLIVYRSASSEDHENHPSLWFYWPKKDS